MMSKLRTTLLFLLCCCSMTLWGQPVVRDPTQPPGYQSEVNRVPETLVVNSIIIAPTRKVAVLNHKQVQEGGTIYGAKVVEIKPHGVLLDDPHKGQYEVPMASVVRKKHTGHPTNGVNS